MKRYTVLSMTGMAVAALLTGCASMQSTVGAPPSHAAASAWPPVMYPETPGVFYEPPDPGFDGYDARVIWAMCNTQATESYPQLFPQGEFDYQAFFLDSVAMPGSAPIDFDVRIPMGIRDTTRVGTMVCYVSGGPASPYIAAIAPYGF